MHEHQSVQFSRSFVCDSVPHGLQHSRCPCPSPTPGVIQTHVHWVSDAIQSPYPLLSPSPSTFNLSQHQDLFKWVSSSHEVAKVFEFQLQHLSFQWIFNILNIQWIFNIQWFSLGLTCLISLQSKGLSRVFFNTTVQKHQLFGAQPSLFSSSHVHTWLLEKPQLWLNGLFFWPINFSAF